MSDSFADLWNTSVPLPAKPKPQTLTLAARLAEEKKRHHHATTAAAVDVQSQKEPDVSHAAWAGLDSLDSSGGIRVKVDDDDDWGLRDFGSVAVAAAAVNSADSNPKSKSTSTSTSKTLWDLDEFASSTVPTPPRSTASYLNPQSRPISRSTSRLSSHHHSSSSSSQVHQQKVDSPDMDFDFGSREDQDEDRATTNSQALKSSALLHLLDDDNEHDSLMGGTGNHEDEEDILGVLSKPVEVVIAKKNSDSRTSTAPLSQPTPLLKQGSRPPSPPPHVLGQIVEMGFSVSQAKKALAATGNGQDVQAALENLLNGGNNLNDRSPTPSIHAAQTRATPPPSHPPNARKPPKGQKERERERKERELLRTRREDTSSSSSTRAGTTTTADIQDQADKLLLQASEIGLSVLSRASAFWKEGKEKVVKVMEERSGGGAGTTSSGIGIEERGRGKNVDGRSRVMDGGRPKWMKEIVNHEDEDDEFGGGGEGFKDVGVEERIEVAHRREPTVDLFSSDPIPSRPVSQQQRPPLSQRPSQARTNSRPPPPQRTLLTTSSSTLSLASTHKNTGTSQFKLGQYGPASESYTSAITLLPPGHLLLVPLYTNRSLARLRCGEYVGAGEDAGDALKIICVVVDSNSNVSSGNVIWNPDTELPELIQGGRDKLNQGGWLDSRGVGVDLVDGYVKALRRRAEAWEGREKWVEAGKDWEVLAGGGGGVGGGWIGEGIKKEAVRGAGRCRRMVSAGGQENIGPSSSSSAPKQSLPKLKPSPRPPPPSSSQPSKALLAHQATTLRAEADDTLKHQLKDSVDARISAWKNGRETNIRALLASLDMVLWDEILSGGGVKVNGLGELVTNTQVKKGYVRAIAKVHPDKFNSSNSTVEQRMLANSVFAALNEAWIAFQGGK